MEAPENGFLPVVAFQSACSAARQPLTGRLASCSLPGVANVLPQDMHLFW